VRFFFIGINWHHMPIRATGNNSMIWGHCLERYVEALYKMNYIRMIFLIFKQVNQQLAARVVVEAGVWRGGASILAAAVLQEALDAQQEQIAARGSEAPLTQTWTVALCDSFRGLPVKSTDVDADWWHSVRQLRVYIMDYGILAGKMQCY